MNGTTLTTRTVWVDAPDLLHRAADALRTGEISWGTGFFIHRDTGCRCALGAIAYAADPADPDGDPRWVDHEMRLTATVAADALAAFLVDEWGAADAGDYTTVPGPEQGPWQRDAIEVVGGWNDADGRTVGDVINALEAAAALAPKRVTR